MPLSVVRLYHCRPHPCTSPIPLSKSCCRSCVWQKSSIRRKPSAGCERRGFEIPRLQVFTLPITVTRPNPSSLKHGNGIESATALNLFHSDSRGTDLAQGGHELRNDGGLSVHGCHSGDQRTFGSHHWSRNSQSFLQKKL